MTVSQAVSKRIIDLLKSKNMSVYKLEKVTSIPQSTMCNLINGVNSGVNLKIIMQIARGLNISLAEFCDYPLFEDENLEIY